jgi:hypothetical protein
MRLTLEPARVRSATRWSKAYGSTRARLESDTKLEKGNCPGGQVVQNKAHSGVLEQSGYCV